MQRKRGLIGDRSVDSPDQASGGFTHSHLWPQIIASTLQRELVVPTWGETSSLGAALWAMLGTGALASFADIHPLVPLGEAYAPQADEAALYAHLFTLYKGLYASLRPAFDQLAEIRNQDGGDYHEPSL